MIAYRLGGRLARSALILALLGTFSLSFAGSAIAGGEELVVHAVDDRADGTRVTVGLPSAIDASRLGAEAVEVRVDGSGRAVTLSSVAAAPMAAAIAIDVSGSMQGEALEQAKLAVGELLASLPDDAQVGVLSFADEAQVVAPFTADRARTQAAVDALTASGETALRDAIVRGVSLLDAVEVDRRSLVVLTDGTDTASAATIEDAAASAATRGLTVYGVALVAGAEVAPGQLAMVLGGADRVTVATDPSVLAPVFRRIAGELLNAITITIPQPIVAGAVVDVTVRDDGIVATTSLVVGAGAALAIPEPPTRTITGSAAAAPWLGPLGVSLVVLALAVVGLALGTSLSGRSFLVSEELRRTPREQFESASDRVEVSLGRLARLDAANERLEQAGLRLRPGEFMTGWCLVVLAAPIAGYAGWGTAGAVVAAVVAIAGPPGILHFLAKRRRQQFEDQLADNLQLAASSLRAGHGLVQAFDAVGKFAADPAGAEFRRMVTEARLGRPATDSLQAAASRMGSADLAWVASAVEIQQQTGGNLAELLDRVAVTIRERARMRRRIAAVTAESRMSASVLTALPFLVFAALYSTSPDYLSSLIDTGGGRILLVVGAAFLGAGVLWLRQIVEADL